MSATIRRQRKRKRKRQFIPPRNRTTTIQKWRCFRTLSGPANAASISSEGDGLLVLLDVLEELDGTGQLPAIDGLGGFARVLEGNSQVSTAGAG